MWEYQLTHIKFGTITDASMIIAKAELDSLGNSRWEAVSMVERHPGGVVVLFKRYTQEYLDSLQKGA